MRVLKQPAGTVRAIFHRNRVGAEVDEELREYPAAPADAKAAALIRRLVSFERAAERRVAEALEQEGG